MRQVKEFLLNTPEQYWFVVFGYHVHKSFWGVLLIVSGLFWTWRLCVAGVALVSISVAGHVYTDNRPYFKLWERHRK